MRERRLGDLRQNDGEAVTTFQADSAQHVRDAVGQVGQLAEGIPSRVGAGHVDQSQPARRERVSARGPDVETLRHAPPESARDLGICLARQRERPEPLGQGLSRSARTARAAWYPLPTAPGVPGWAV